MRRQRAVLQARLKKFSTTATRTRGRRARFRASSTAAQSTRNARRTSRPTSTAADAIRKKTRSARRCARGSASMAEDLGDGDEGEAAVAGGGEDRAQRSRSLAAIGAESAVVEEQDLPVGET